ncbi:MAG: hypothetical protein ACKOWL_04990 [Sphingobacteriaceae bacterium]
MKKYIFFLLSTVMLGVNCRKEKKTPINIDCAAFTAALVTNDAASVEKQVNAFFDSLTPISTAYDKFGYEIHFYDLANQLDACSDIVITYSSYAGLQTYPPLGEITMNLQINGQIIIWRLYTSYDIPSKKYHFISLESI